MGVEPASDLVGTIRFPHLIEWPVWTVGAWHLTCTNLGSAPHPYDHLKFRAKFKIDIRDLGFYLPHPRDLRV